MGPEPHAAVKAGEERKGAISKKNSASVRFFPPNTVKIQHSCSAA
jgi:hypothetical protein